MSDSILNQLPPLQGCLYCHAEGTTTLSKIRKLLGFGSDYPLLKCSRCGAVALLDANADQWRIRYRRVNKDRRFYYVAIHLGRAGWLSARKALEISTNGYVQRCRVQQAHTGDLSWLHPAPLQPSLPLMSHGEEVYLTLKGVTYQDAPLQGFLSRADRGRVRDSGKFYVTDRRLYLLGQRQDWSYPLTHVEKVTYDSDSWTVVLSVPGEQPQQFRGIYVTDQFDPQLVAAVIKALWQSKM